MGRIVAVMVRRSLSPDSDIPAELADVPQLSARDAARGDLQAAVQEIHAGGKRRFLVVRYRRAQAALVSLEDLALLLRLDSWTWDDIALLKEKAHGDEPAQEEPNGG